MAEPEEIKELQERLESQEDTTTSCLKRTRSPEVQEGTQVSPAAKKLRKCSTEDKDTNDVVFFKKGFKCLQKLGEGTYGSVFKLIETTTDKVFAYKISKITDEFDRLTVDKEIKALKTLKGHKNIVLFLDSDHRDNEVGLLLEFIDHNLREILTVQNENGTVMLAEWIKSLIQDLLAGVAFIHSNDLIHFDLKPCNLLVSSNGSLKIADFGLTELREDRPFEFEKATESYRPPECYLRPELMDTSVDIWSTGVIVLELVTGEVVVSKSQGWHRAGLLATLYGCKGNFNRLSEVLGQKNSPPPKLNSNFKDRASASLASLVKRLLRCNPEERLSAEAALGHKYFQESPSGSLPDVARLLSKN
ncbi:cyclin-dependent kinase 5-like [Oratosquilla oratoria]|uniref:cyclin-dependent kinase 5-like n=1 Tax=Oratosquilla oratoria TaxID=337810 RepID=UPI003F77797C